MGDGPIFLTGVYRSGTTLVAQVLNNHPRLRIIYDTLHFFRFYLGRYTPVEEQYAAIVRDAERRLAQRFDISVPTERILDRLRNRSHIQMKNIYEAIMIETFCNGIENIRWGEKSLLQWTNIPLFLQMFPDGQAIHIIRDPRDVLASYREYTHEVPYRYLDAVFCCLHSMNWASTIGASLSKDRYLLLRHEDLVTAKEGTALALCDFLKITYDPVMLETSQFLDQRRNPWTGDSSFGDVNQAIAPVSVGRWRTKLEGFEVMFVESILSNLLPRFGYEASDLKTNADELCILWDRIRHTPLLQSRLSQWLETGEGVEKYPSDPTDRLNWEETVREG